jgi:serine/threonine protein kinase
LLQNASIAIMSWSLENGRVLDHFRIVSPIGAGGMGEVYLAEDVRLGRKVALKILTTRLDADDDRLRRFEQEARTVSALNHPNILTLHDIGASDGVRLSPPNSSTVKPCERASPAAAWPRRTRSMSPSRWLARSPQHTTPVSFIAT